MSEYDNEIHLPIKTFDCQEVKKRIHEILHDHLHDKKYDLKECNSLVKYLSNIIKDSLKKLGYDRYKFIINVIISPQTNDPIQMITRSYWDSETDKFAQSIYINEFLICISTAFAVFYY